MRLTTLVLLTLAPAVLQAQQPGSFATDSAVQALIDARAAMVPNSGIVIGLTDASGRRVLGAGTVNGPGTAAPDGATVYEIGSVTKTFTATLLAEMAVQGQARLDQPVAKLLPDSVHVPQYQGISITLLDLATQSSGLPRLPDNLNPPDMADPYADYTAADLYAFLSSYALPREPGARYEYSNLGVGLLGFALARRANTDYERLVRDRIAEPLGMSDTRIILTPDEQARLAPGHDIGGDMVPNWDMSVLAGAGGLRSTARDMLAYVAAYLAPGDDDLGRAMTMAAEPRRPTTIPGMRIGLAWHVREQGGRVIIWHNGATGGYHAFAGFDPARHLGVVILTNSQLSVDDLGFHLLDPSMPVTPPSLPPRRTAISLSPAELEPLVGEYQLAPGAILSVTRDSDQLYIQLTGQSRFPVYPETGSRFFLRVVDAVLEFERDASGEVTAVVLHQNGRDVRGVRTEK